MDQEKKHADQHDKDDVSQNYKLEQAADPNEEYENSLDLKLSEDDQKQIAIDIKLLITEYEGKMTTAKITQQWKEAKKQYEDELENKTWPYEGCSNHHEPIIYSKVNALLARAIKIIFGDRKIWVFRPTEKSDIDGCKRKETYIDYLANVVMKLKAIMAQVWFNAILYGVGFVAITFYKETKRFKDVESYNGKADLEKFLANYPDAATKYPEYYADLQADKQVDLIVSYDDIVYKGAKAQSIEPEDIIADIDIKEPERQLLYGYWEHYTKDELLALEHDKKFKDVARLWAGDEEKSKDEIQEKDTKIYDIARVIYKFTPKGKSRAEDCVFHVSKDKDIILSEISYPYWHQRPYLIPVYWEPKGTKFFRKGLGYRLKQIQATVDALMQQAIDSNSIASVPSFSCDDPDFNPSLFQFFPGCTIPSQLKQANISSNNEIGVTLKISQFLKQSGDDVSGVSANLTGKANPVDPTAPGNKTKALIYESNINLAMGIWSLKDSMQEIGFQIAQLEYQFGEKEKEFRILGTSEAAFEKITRDDLRIRGDFVPQGTLEVLDPEVVFQKNKFLFEELSKVAEIQANPIAKNLLIRNLVSSTGDVWEMQVDNLAPTPLENMQQISDFNAKAKAKEMEIKQNQYKADLISQGKTPQGAEITSKAMHSTVASKAQLQIQLPKDKAKAELEAANGPGVPAQTGQELPQVPQQE